MHDKSLVRVTIEGLQPPYTLEQEDCASPYSPPPAPSTVTRELTLPASASIEQLKQVISDTGEFTPILRVNHSIEPRTVALSTNKLSVYDEDAPGGLKIGRDTTLIEYYNTWLERKGLKKLATPEQSSATATEDGLRLADIPLSLHRTLRVPDDGETYHLPPGLGTFPLKPVSECSNVPASIAAQGGYIAPLAQREALWIGIGYGVGSKAHALKIHVGGINALSGLPRYAPRSQIEPDFQDYVVAGRQPWLDGICTEPGVVRQFVAMPLGKGYTVEEQLTGRAEVGAIQFDIFSRLDEDVKFSLKTPEGLDAPLDVEDLYKTPRELDQLDFVGHLVMRKKQSLHDGLPDDLPLSAFAKDGRLALHALCAAAQPHWRGPWSGGKIFVKTLTGKIITITMDSSQTILELKAKVQDKEGIPPDQIRLIYAGVPDLADDATPDTLRIAPGTVMHLALRLRGGGVSAFHRTGIAAGGRIKQDISKDPKSIRAYSKNPTHRVFIHPVNSEMWELLTGTIAPLSPVTSAMYEDNALPWFDYYSETPTSLAGAFPDLKSLANINDTIEKQLSTPLRHKKSAPVDLRRQLLDPDSPPPCSVHRDENEPATSVNRPCGHFECRLCFFQRLGLQHQGPKFCFACNAEIERSARFGTAEEGRHLAELGAIQMEKVLKGVKVGDGRVCKIGCFCHAVRGLSGRI